MASAPGIPDREVMSDPSKLQVNAFVDYLLHQHDAKRAGPHTDLRIGTPETGLHSWAVRKGMPPRGGKHLAIIQSLHDYGYKDFSGEIKCLTGDTPIQTSLGVIPIKDADPDRYDVEVLGVGSRGLGFYKIKRLYHKSGHTSWVRLHFYTPVGKLDSILCGREHGIYVDGTGFIQAGELRAGTEILFDHIPQPIFHNLMAGVAEKCKISWMVRLAKDIWREVVHAKTDIGTATAATDVPGVHRLLSLSPVSSESIVIRNELPWDSISYLSAAVYPESAERFPYSLISYSEAGSYGCESKSFCKIQTPEFGSILKLWGSDESGTMSPVPEFLSYVGNSELPQFRHSGSPMDYGGSGYSKLFTDSRMGPAFYLNSLFYLEIKFGALLARVSRFTSLFKSKPYEPVVDVMNGTLCSRGNISTGYSLFKQVFDLGIKFLTSIPCYSANAHIKASLVRNVPLKVKIAQVEDIVKYDDAYDIEVEDSHNYFANGVLVHNSGYGAGKVSIADKGSVLITKAGPDELSFTIADKRYPESYKLLKTDDKRWLLMNTTPINYKTLQENPKPKYTVIDPKKAASLMDGSNAVSAKLDGASSLIEVLGDRIEAISYRPGKMGPISYAHKLGLTGIAPDPSLKGTVLRGEVMGFKNGKAIPPQELGGVLNSTLVKSRATQQARNINMKAAIFDVVKSPDTDDLDTYRKRLAAMQSILARLPQDKFMQAPTETDSHKALDLFRRIKSGRHPMTREGVVITPLDQPGAEPMKAKFGQEADVHIKDILPGEGKYKGKGAGAFTYSIEPKGEAVGKVGTGISDSLRKDMLENPDSYIGRIARINAQEQFPSGAWRSPALLAIHEG